MHDVTPDATQPRGVTRRQAFRAGGVALLGAGALAACSDDTPVSVTGTTGPEPTTTTVPDPSDTDLVFLRTAASLELSAVGFYDQVLALSTFSIGPELRELAVLFAAHHQQHADLLDRKLSEAGGEVVEQSNEVYDAELVDAPLAAATTDDQVLQAALALEAAAAGAYVDGGATLSRADLRKSALQIGSSDARHEAYLTILLAEPEVVSEAFAPAEAFQADAQLPPGTLTDPDEGDAEGDEDSEESEE